MASPPATHPTSTDVFSLSDDVLSEKLQFIEEVGFGNWGSVWLAQPKNAGSKDQVTQQHPQNKIAVKLVHRSKTSTTAARVKSLWNEMKIVRPFKNDSHPSIVPFYSFIITPSYALITMAYLPTLVPVEVSEPKARDWFRSLLSGVKFLHERGVVHNDIKPANILLSTKQVPVLVDFGFAERYDLASSKAFHSNLSYGTPEYLSPERARGLPHDTRKSDIWSLGVTFFEILVGRTPFEYSDGEQFSTKEELEKYWSRTLKGHWVGTWSISPAGEDLLRRMIAPNADLRCNAIDAMHDAYWQSTLPSSPRVLRKSSSLVSSVVFEKDPVKLKAAAAAHRTARPTPTKGKENDASAAARSPGPDGRSSKAGGNVLRASKSQPKVLSSSKGAKHRVPVPPPGDLSPIKGSAPSANSFSPKSPPGITSKAGEKRAIHPHKHRDTNLPPTPPKNRVVPRPRPEVKPSHNRNISAQGALAATAQLKKERTRSRDMSRTGPVVSKGSQSARDRVKDWEREKERLREMARLEEFERDRDEEIEEENAMKERMRKANEARARASKSREVTASPISTGVVPTPKSSFNEPEPDVEPSPPKHTKDVSTVSLTGWEQEREMIQLLERKLQRVGSKSGSKFIESSSIRSIPRDGEDGESNLPGPSWAPSPPSAMRVVSTPELNMFGSGKLSGSGSPYQTFRHSIRRSIDKGISLCKTSVTKKRTSIRTLSMDNFDEAVDNPRAIVRRESWEEEALREANSSLPVVRHALRNEQVGQDNRVDRMTIWLRNVEQVVEDARQNFATASPPDVGARLPALPPPPLSRATSQTRSHRSTRLPRKILAASQIFSDESFLMASGNQTFSSFVTSVHASPSPSRTGNESNAQDTDAQQQVSHSSDAPESRRETDSLDSPASSKKDNSKSQSDLLVQQKIAPNLEQLELELSKQSLPPSPSSPLLSNIDRSIFVATPPRVNVSDDLCSSPLHVDPYPPRPTSTLIVPDTPQQRRVEGVYDRFLMATSGVKRVGKGYQSDFQPPPRTGKTHLGHPAPKTIGHSGAQENIAPSPPSAGKDEQKKKKYHTMKAIRRKMPPPVSSEDLLRASSLDQGGQWLGMDEVDGEPRRSDVDELGMVMASPTSGGGTAVVGGGLRDRTNNHDVTHFKKDQNNSNNNTLVRKALHVFGAKQAGVSKKRSSRLLS